VTRRVASLGPTESFADISLDLNEERTYYASSFAEDCGESGFSSPFTILHDDIVAPSPPDDFTAVASGGSIVASWSLPVGGDVVGYKVLVAEQTGGPYSQVHSGLLGSMTSSTSFQSVSGRTYYVIAKAVDHANNESVPTAEVEVIVP